jgi:hypothetical protein
MLHACYPRIKRSKQKKNAVKQVASSTRILPLQIESLDYVAFCFLVFRINRQLTGMREAAAAITDQQTT